MRCQVWGIRELSVAVTVVPVKGSGRRLSVCSGRGHSKRAKLAERFVITVIAWFDFSVGRRVDVPGVKMRLWT